MFDKARFNWMILMPTSRTWPKTLTINFLFSLRWVDKVFPALWGHWNWQTCTCINPLLTGQCWWPASYQGSEARLGAFSPSKEQEFHLWHCPLAAENTQPLAHFALSSLGCPISLGSQDNSQGFLRMTRCPHCPCPVRVQHSTDQLHCPDFPPC